MNKHLISGFMLVVVLTLITTASTLRADETISGIPRVLNSTTMMVDNKTVRLDYIYSLKPGSKCVWKNRPLDCGVLATAGLKDLVAGAKAICRQNTSGKYTCTAGGYDLAYGLIHAGWAVPNSTAPARYFNKQERSKKRQLGLWSATNPDGKTIAALISEH